MSDREVNEIVEKMDKNKDGRVSFAEVRLRFFIFRSEININFIFSLRKRLDQEARRDTERSRYSHFCKYKQANLICVLSRDIPRFEI